MEPIIGFFPLIVDVISSALMQSVLLPSYGLPDDPDVVGDTAHVQHCSTLVMVCQSFSTTTFTTCPKLQHKLVFNRVYLDL